MDKIEITSELLSVLKAKAEKATQGEWKVDDLGYIFRKPQASSEEGKMPLVPLARTWKQVEQSKFDSTYIAAVNPAVVLGLIERIQLLEMQNEDLSNNIYDENTLNDPQALTSAYFAGLMAEGRKRNAEIDKLLEENRQLKEENERLKIEAHDLDSSGAETAKEAEQWQAVAEKLAEYCAAFCELTLRCDCDECPLYDQSGCVGDTKVRALKKAKKELGYE